MGQATHLCIEAPFRPLVLAAGCNAFSMTDGLANLVKWRNLDNSGHSDIWVRVSHHCIRAPFHSHRSAAEHNVSSLTHDIPTLGRCETLFGSGHIDISAREHPSSVSCICTSELRISKNNPKARYRKCCEVYSVPGQDPS